MFCYFVFDYQSSRMWTLHRRSLKSFPMSKVKVRRLPCQITSILTAWDLAWGCVVFRYMFYSQNASICESNNIAVRGDNKLQVNVKENMCQARENMYSCNTDAKRGKTCKRNAKRRKTCNTDAKRGKHVTRIPGVIKHVTRVRVSSARYAQENDR